MSSRTSGAEDTKGDQRERVRQLVAKLVDGTGLQVCELANGLALRIHVTRNGDKCMWPADGYVCWEWVAWDFWGAIEGLEGMYSTRGRPWEENPGEAFVACERIVECLA